MTKFRNAGRRAIVSASAAICLGVIAGGVASWMFPNNAFADSSCFNYQHYNTNTTEDKNIQHRGTRTHAPGMFVFDEPPVCDHVSAIWSYASDGEFVEVGWDSQANGTTYSKDYCTWQGNGQPTVFKFWVGLNGKYNCSHFQTLAPDQWHSFAVYNQNGNGVWNFTMDGNHIGNDIPMNFVGSASETNGERFGVGETADAAFTGLEYMDVNGAWQTWTRADCGGNGIPDPVWNNSIAQPDAVTVLQGPAVGC